MSSNSNKHRISYTVNKERRQPKEVSIDYASFDAAEQDRYHELSSISNASSAVGYDGKKSKPVYKLNYTISADNDGDKDWEKPAVSPPPAICTLRSVSPTKNKKKAKQSKTSIASSWFPSINIGSGDGGSKRQRPRYDRNDSVASTASFSQSEDFKRIFDDDGNEQYGEVASVGRKSPSKGSKASAAGGGDYYSFTEDAYEVADGTDPEKEIYYVQQRYGYLSIVFSLCQTAVLAIMMINCGVAPFNINPMIGPYPDALSEWGAKNAVNILQDGEWYRLVTPIMLHAGVIHLLCNVAVQVETGAFFEREWGSRNWLIIYLSSAVGSSILSVIFMPDAISVGSSGAVMGLFGGKLAEIICRFCESTHTNQARISHQVRKEQCAAVVCSVTVVMLFSFIPYVDWAAHLGGVIAGLCVGLVIFGLEITTSIWKTLWFLIGLASTTVYFAVTLQHMYSGEIEPVEELRDVCGYYKEYFDDYECNCMREEQEGGGGDKL